MNPPNSILRWRYSKQKGHPQCVILLFVALSLMTMSNRVRQLATMTTMSVEPKVEGPNNKILHHSQDSPVTIRGSSDGEKLKLYLHIGPTKTGTTTIQDLLAYYHLDLEKDNITFLGKINQKMASSYALQHDTVRSLNQWIRGTNRKNNEKNLQKFAISLQEAAKKSQNVVLSNEDFSKIYSYHLNHIVQDLHDLFDPLFQVHVIMVYRPYMDWLQSRYSYSSTKPLLTNAWPEQENQSTNGIQPNPPGRLPKLREALAWPFNLPLIEPLVKVYSAIPRSNNSTMSTSNSLWTIHIIDIQNSTSGDVGMDMLCQIMEPAKQACSHYRYDTQQKGTTVRSNVATSTTSDDQLLAMFVHYDIANEDDRSWRAKGMKRPKTVRLVRNIWKEWLQQQHNISVTYVELPWSIRSQWKSNSSVPAIEYHPNDGSMISTALEVPPINNTVLANGTPALSQWWQHRRRDNEITIPLECPTRAEYDWIWNKTLSEESFFQKYKCIHDTLEGKFRKSLLLESFQRKFVERHRYCHVDWEVLYYQNQSWRSHLLSKLKTST